MYLSTQSARPPSRYLMGAALSRRRLHRPMGMLSASSGMGWLSAITPDQAAEQIFPQAKIRGGAGHNQATRASIVAAAQSGMLSPAYDSPSTGCAGVGLLKPALLATAGGLALKFAAATGPAAPFVLLAAGILEIFGTIFGHHAAAVKKERSILCAAVPAAQQSLDLIDQAVQQGQATPQDAITALDNVVNGFQQAVQPIIHGADPTSSGECNAACYMLSELRAIVLVKKSQYQDLADAQAKAAANPAAAVTGVVSSAAASIGLPPWALYAAGGLLLWKLL